MISDSWCCFASPCARTTPATEHSSVMASATSCSGCDAPRRKLKLEAHCSSA